MSATIAATCPSWCTGEHQPVDLDLDGSRYHPGPMFGSIEISGTTGPEGQVRDLGYALIGDRGQVSALRQLAADALAAAAWMESQS